MKKNTFGKTGYRVSPIGFGGAPVGYLGVDQERINTILGRLLDAGVNVIDTAACYPGSEAAIGRAVAHRRDDYVLVTKCGHKVEGVRGADWSARLIGETVDRALEKLRTDHIDVMLLHSCDLKILKKGDAIGALVKARDAGKIRWLGYSGDNKPALYAAGLPDVAVIQISVSICDQANLDDVLPAARENNVGVMAKRPIANAAWRKPSEQSGIYADYARTYRQRLGKMDITPEGLGFEGDPGVVWPEIALRFTLSQPGISTAIIGTTNPGRVDANIAALKKGPLPAPVLKKIRAAFKKAEARSGKRWTGQI